MQDTYLPRWLPVVLFFVIFIQFIMLTLKMMETPVFAL